MALAAALVATPGSASPPDAAHAASSSARVPAEPSIVPLESRHRSQESHPLRSFQGGYFEILTPPGWSVTPTGLCTSFALMVRDPETPRHRAFYFSALGPVYMSERQKEIDARFLRGGGEAIEWFDSPVVEPFTPEKFVDRLHLLGDSGVAPSLEVLDFELEDVRVVRSWPLPALFSEFDGETELLRVVYRDAGGVGEALLLVTVAPFLSFQDAPGGGVGYALSFTGVSVPQGELDARLELLTRTIGSLWLSPSYIRECRGLQTFIYDGINRPRRFLGGFAQVMRDGWERRDRADDILAEQLTDGLLDRERLYDPDTGEVYRFDMGFFARYDDRRDEYRLDNLRRMPEDAYELWMKEPLDGSRHVR